MHKVSVCLLSLSLAAYAVEPTPTAPKKVSVAPPMEVVPPFLNFAPLDQASDDLTTAAIEREVDVLKNATKMLSAS